MIDILIKGGPILWVIIALSFVGAVIIIERLLYFRKIGVDEDKLIARLKPGGRLYCTAMATMVPTEAAPKIA